MTTRRTGNAPIAGIWLGRKLRRLAPAQLESALAGAQLFEASGPDGIQVVWSKSAEKGVLFDLSSVEWVEIGALVQLVLLVEKAILDGIPTMVATPLAAPREDETRWAANTAPTGRFNPERWVESRVAGRRRACRFLDYLKFIPALRSQHLVGSQAMLDVWNDFDTSLYDPEESATQSDIDASSRDPVTPGTGPDAEEGTYRFDVPLTWLSSHDGQAKLQLATLLAGILGEHQRGLQEQLAKAIANVVLYELIDNVESHANGPTYALVAASARSERYIASRDPQRYRKDFLGYESDYIDWIVGDPKPLIEIVIGDSGCGIPRRLGPRFDDTKDPRPFDKNRTANILAWAFDRWSSTSEDSARRRGTRGLYRVDRVVKRTQGLVAVRAADEVVALDHGGPGHDTVVRASEQLAPLPGTVLRIRMPAFQKSVFLQRISTALVAARGAAGLQEVQLGPLTPLGLSASDTSKLAEALKAASQSLPPRPILAVIQGGSEEKRALEGFFEKAVELRHPAALAICGLPGGWAQIDAAIDSVNQTLLLSRHHDEAVREDHHEIWAPVLVIDSNDYVGWVGTEPKWSELLTALVTNGGRIAANELSKMVPSEEDRLALLQNLRVDTHLVEVQADGSIQFLPPFIENLLAGKLRDHILSGGKGVTKGPFWSPSLVLRSMWVEVSSALEASVGHEIPMLVLAQRVRSSLDGRTSPTVLVADTSTDPRIVDRLVGNLGVQKILLPGDGGLPLRRGSSIFPPSAGVVVFCEVLASGDAARRILDQIRRDKATPIVIACVIDSREDTGLPIEAGDRKIPVASLVQVDLRANSSTAGRQVGYIDSAGRGQETERNDLVPNAGRPLPFRKEILHPLIEAKSALHLGHTGELLGRHFTLYLDAGPLLEDGSIVQSFNDEIEKWMRETGTASRDLELWYPTPEPKVAGPARRIAESLHRKLACPEDALKSIPRRSDQLGWSFGPPPTLVMGRSVVIVDWGALSGTSVSQMARRAADAGAKRVLVCVFLSQLPLEDEAFLRSLRVIRGQHVRPGQLALAFSDGSASSAASSHEQADADVPCAVSFLGQFPISVYSRLECPVCEQRDRLWDENLPSDFLRDYREWEHKRLRLRRRDEARDEPPIKTAVMQIRETLTQGLVSTRKRAEFALDMAKWSATCRDKTSPAPLEALLLIRLLAFEHHWLRSAPLNLERQREQVAAMARAVAINGDMLDEDRINAVAVLRMTSKFVFASSLEDLLRSASNKLRLLQQISYNTLTCFQRPYRQSLRVVKSIETALHNVASSESEGKIEFPPDFNPTLRILALRAEVETYNSEAAQLTPVEAWRKLREWLKTDHLEHSGSTGSAILTVLLRPFGAVIQRALEGLHPGQYGDVSLGVLESIRAASVAWRQCCQWLDTSILPLLRVLRDILEGKHFVCTVGAPARARLLQLCDSATIAESEFSRLTDALANEPEKLLEPVAWRTFQTEARWYYENVLMDAPGLSSPFRSFFRLEPTRLRSALQNALGTLANTGIKVGLAADWPTIFEKGDPPIFCAFSLVSQTLEQVLKNVDTHRVGDSEPEVRIDIEIDERSQSATLTIKNNHTTSARKHKGVGLADLRDRLQPFEAHLSDDIRPDDGWSSYVAKLEFRIEPST